MSVSGDILAVAHRELMKEIPDAMSTANGLLAKLALRRKKILNGGDGTFQFAVMLEENEAEGFITGTTDVLSLNPNQNFFYGTLQYKYFRSTTAITLADFATTQDSPNAIADLAVAKKNAAKATMVRTISQAMYTSGTSANLKFNGMDDIFAAPGISYAGLNDSDYPNWAPLIDSSSTTVSYSVISNLLGTLSERTNQQPIDTELRSNYKVDLMISRADVQSRFKSQLQVQQRFMDEELVKAGFNGIEVDGVAWVVDGYANANSLYILSSDSFHFGSRYGFWSGRTSPLDSKQPLPNQSIEAMTSYHVGNLWCENRRVNALANALAN